MARSRKLGAAECCLHHDQVGSVEVVIDLASYAYCDTQLIITIGLWVEQVSKFCARAMKLARAWYSLVASSPALVATLEPKDINLFRDLTKLT